MNNNNTNPADLIRNPAFYKDNLYIGLQRKSIAPLVKRPGPFEGTEAYLYLRGHLDDHSGWRSKLPPEALEAVGIDEKKAWAFARKNLLATGMTNIFPMSDIFPMLQNAGGPSMYVITNKENWHGAAQILNRNAIREYFAKERPDVTQLLAIPSSIHECLLVIADDVKNLSDITTMISEVNASQVAEVDQLADDFIKLPLGGNTEIWQLKDEEHTFAFESFDWVERNGFSVDKSHYALVYVCDTDGDLEKIFERFNLDHPFDFKGHSLSVSDVVVVNGKAFYVDLIGFKAVEAWNDDNQKEVAA